MAQLNKTELATLLCRSVGIDRRDGFDVSSILALRHKGQAFTLAAHDEKRLELLAKLRQGDEVVEVEVDIRAFQQVDGVSNRNFIRFKKSILRKLAKSFTNVPLLKDHDRDSDSRGGTVIASAAVKIDGGLAFDQTIRLTAPFAVDAFLSGNLDRFSIGWDFPALDVIHCSSGLCPAFGGDCPHLPGDLLEDGTRAEFIFMEADGVEVSTVTVPAVKGTGLEQIRSALAAGKLLSKQRDESAEDQSMKSIAKTLGLNEDADESTIVAGIGALTARAESAETALAAERTSHTGTKTELATSIARVSELDAQGLGRDIDSLCTEFAGKLPKERDAEGKLTVSSKLEIQIRGLAVKDLPGARAMLEAIQSQVPALGEVPRSIATQDGQPAPVIPLSAHGQSDIAKKQRAQLGISDEDFAKYNSIDGTETAHLREAT